MAPNESFISSLNIPLQLKEYFLKSVRVKKYLTRESLEDIEDIYLLFNSLYIFDKSSFSSYVILSLNKSKEFDYYHHLKNVLENEMKKISKVQSSEQIRGALTVEQSIIRNLFKESAQMIMDYTEGRENEDFTEYYKYIGKLELIDLIIKDEDFKLVIDKENEKLDLMNSKKTKQKSS